MKDERDEINKEKMTLLTVFVLEGSKNDNEDEASRTSFPFA